jgi:hypothetical protein
MMRVPHALQRETLLRRCGTVPGTRYLPQIATMAARLP